MSAAVMPMRTVCADAVDRNAASNPAASGAALRNTLTFFIAVSPLDAISLQGLCQHDGPQNPAAGARTADPTGAIGPSLPTNWAEANLCLARLWRARGNSPLTPWAK